MLEPWLGEPLVRHVARLLLSSGLDPVVAVVSAGVRDAGALDGLAVVPVVNPDADRGISRSIAMGLEALPETVDAAMIAVADQPRLDANAIRRIRGAFRPGVIAVPRYGDHRGNPAVFDRRFFAELRRLEGDRGGQSVIDAHPDAVVEIPLPESMGVDVDAPEDWPTPA